MQQPHREQMEVLHMVSALRVTNDWEIPKQEHSTKERRKGQKRAGRQRKDEGSERFD